MTTFQGQVLSIKNQHTATVLVRSRARHPLYGKAISKTKRYHVHDPLGVKVGDVVEFTPCRPMSRTKKWVITKVLNTKGLKVENKATNQQPKSGNKKSPKIKKINPK